VLRGRLVLPRSLKRAQACGSGTVVLRAGRRVVAIARVGRTCRFHARLRRRARGRLRARFNGNRALLPASVRVRRPLRR
jgi:hypothetical protein